MGMFTTIEYNCKYSKNTLILIINKTFLRKLAKIIMVNLVSIVK